MADVRLGGAFVEVELDLKKANAQVAAWGSKGIPAQKTVVTGQQQHTAAVKQTNAALQQTNATLAAQTAHVNNILGITQKQAGIAAAVAAKTQGSLQASSKAGMIGAQLSYGLQDLLTGASMGNMNMALLGMSNNLSMIAMQFGSLGGMITSVALAALPMIYTGLKTLISDEKAAKEAVDALTAAFERQKFAMQLNAVARQALTDKEVKRMRDARQIEGHIENEQNEIKKLSAAINDHRKSIQSAEAVIGGRSAGSFAVKAADDADVAKHAKLVEDLAKQQAKFPGAKLLASEGELQRSVEALDKKYDITIGGKPGQFQVKSTREGLEFIKTPMPEERATAIKQKTEASTAMTEAEAKKKVAEADAAKLTERRNELLRRDLGIMQRTANAGFNEYEQAKIKLERKHIEERQELRDRGFGEVPLGPKMTEKEKEAKIDASNKAEQEELDANIKAMNERHEKNMVHGRHLSKKEQKEFADNATEIQDRRAKERDQIVKDFEQGPGTLLDPAMKALKTAQGRERAQLALEYSNRGQTPGHFTGIEQGYKDFASRIGDKGNDIAQKTADNTKGTQEAVRDLITAVNELNLGIGP